METRPSERQNLIDSHLHLWELRHFSYSWLAGVPTLQRDFRLEDVQPMLHDAGVTQVVLIEADNSLAETKWLLEIAAYKTVLAVVGWVDIVSPDLEIDLAELAKHHKFAGVRVNLAVPQIQWLALQRILTILEWHNLTCDVLLSGEPPKRLATLLERHPNNSVILNHFAGADLSNEPKAWADSLEPIAALPHVMLKCSGHRGQQLEPFVNHALRLFGVERLMFGSDYPVCTLGTTYQTTIESLSACLGLRDQQAIFSSNAKRIYAKSG